MQPLTVLMVHALQHFNCLTVPSWQRHRLLKPVMMRETAFHHSRHNEVHVRVWSFLRAVREGTISLTDWIQNCAKVNVEILTTVIQKQLSLHCGCFY